MFRPFSSISRLKQKPKMFSWQLKINWSKKVKHCLVPGQERKFVSSLMTLTCLHSNFMALSLALSFWGNLLIWEDFMIGKSSFSSKSKIPLWFQCALLQAVVVTSFLSGFYASFFLWCSLLRVQEQLSRFSMDYWLQNVLSVSQSSWQHWQCSKRFQKNFFQHQANSSTFTTCETLEKWFKTLERAKKSLL